ncbi:MAG TPA: hypothetical protein DCS93_39285 [Microscillaceae bacterium]|nr:hypothetical protein [Microscillaceae bacterium]
MSLLSKSYFTACILFIICCFQYHSLWAQGPTVTSMQINKGPFNYTTYPDPATDDAAEVPLNDFQIVITFNSQVKAPDGTFIDTKAKAEALFLLREGDPGAGSDLFEPAYLSIADGNVIFSADEQSVTVNLRFTNDLLPNQEYSLEIVTSEVLRKSDDVEAEPYKLVFTTASAPSITAGSATPICNNQEVELSPIVISEASKHTFVRNVSGVLKLTLDNLTAFEFVPGSGSVTVLGDANTTATLGPVTANEFPISYSIGNNNVRFNSLYISGLRVRARTDANVTGHIIVVDDDGRFNINGLMSKDGTGMNDPLILGTVTSRASTSPASITFSTTVTGDFNPGQTRDVPNNSGAQTISLVAPGGGTATFSGTGVFGNAFIPSGLSLGNKVISYTFTNGDGCETNGTFTFNVTNAFAVITGVSSRYCTNEMTNQEFEVNRNAGGGTIAPADVTLERLPSTNIPQTNPSLSSGFGFLRTEATENVFAIRPDRLPVGSYRITATNSLGAKYFATFAISAAPTPVIAASSGSFEVCAGDASSYSTSLAFGRTYLWEISGGGTIAGSNNGRSVTINWTPSSIPDTYTLNLTETNILTGCSNITQRTITVNAQPSPTIVSPSGGLIEACAGETHTYEVQGGINPAHDYTWNVVGGDVTFQATDRSQIMVEWTAGSNRSITLTEENTSDCEASNMANVTINSLPIPSFASGAEEACVLSTDQAYTLNPVAPGSDITWEVEGGSIQGGTPMGGKSVLSGVDLNTVNINWGSTPEGTVTVRVLGANTCTSVATRKVDLNPLPSLAFSGLNEQYCEDETLATLVPTVNGVAPQLSDEVNFIIRDETNTIDIRFLGAGSTTFNPQEIAQTFGKRTYNMVFRYTDIRGCAAESLPVSFRLSPAPEGVRLNISRSFRDNRVSFNADAEGINDDWVWNWNFTNRTSNEQNTVLVLDNNNTQSVAYSLEVRNDLGCAFSFSRSFNINFDFAGKCVGNPTQFTDRTNLGLTAIDSWAWDFGDGNTSTLQNPSHIYTNPGTYLVTLTVRDDFITYSYTRRIDVFPVFQVGPTTPFNESFSAGGNGWISHGVVDSVGFKLDRTSWQLKTPSGFGHIATTFGNAWVTDNTNNPFRTSTDANYNSNEQSYVESPCFDITTLDRPMVSFKYWSDTDPGGDGVVLLYTIDDGITWFRLGQENQGIDWYNTKPILGKPGDDFTINNIDNQGWSGNDQKMTNTWKTARVGLDGVVKQMSDAGITQRMIRFRIAFGSNGDNTPNKAFDGFAFDDFEVSNRNRLVLFEYFINQGVANASALDWQGHNFANTKAEAINLHYHTGFPGVDEVNALNDQDPSGRSFHYGIREVPRAVVDGQTKDSLLGQWAEDIFAKRILLTSPFNIAIGQAIANDGTLSIATTITALQTINRSVVMHVAVIDSTVTLGGETYYNAVRKMLPDAAGTFRAQSWVPGESQTLNLNWNYGELDPSRFRVVVFVADYANKEIYQAAINDQIQIQNNDLQEVKEVTSIAEGVRGNILNVFPNPALSKVNVSWKGKFSEKTISWSIVSMEGKVVKQGQWNTQQKTLSLNISELAQGTYIIKIHHQKGILQRKFKKL